MNPNKLLEEVGLSPNEAKVYLALLKYKKATVTKIAEEAHVNRTTAYDILKYLNEKGLVLKYIENNKTGFTIDSPKRLKSWIKEEERNAKNRGDLLAENFKEIDYLFKSTNEAPNIKYFEGDEQFENYFNDQLNNFSDTMVGYASTRIIEKKVKTKKVEEKYIKYFARERFKRNLCGRYLAQEADREGMKIYMKKYYGKYLVKNPEILRIKILPTKEKRFF